MLKEFTDWLLGLVKKIFGALWDFVVDAAIAIFSGIVDAFASAVAAIPVPDWLANGLQSIYGQLDGALLYYLSQAGFPQALAILGAGYGFRMLRKIVTLFQW